MILRGSVFSQVLEMDTGLTIVTSHNACRTDRTYQVAYLLHGLCGNNGNWSDYTMLPLYANNYNAVFVMPEVSRSFYTDMKYGQKFFSYITDELPEICKSVFNISAKREDTVVIGNSMGGYGALKCALAKPEQYGYCCAFSSACLFLKEYLECQRTDDALRELGETYGEQLVKDFQAIFGERLEWSPRDEIMELARQANDRSIRPKIYSACGTEDYLYEYNARFRDEMAKFYADFTYEEWLGSHDWNFFDEALKKALKFCFGS